MRCLLDSGGRTVKVESVLLVICRCATAFRRLSAEVLSLIAEPATSLLTRIVGVLRAISACPIAKRPLHSDEEKMGGWAARLSERDNLRVSASYLEKVPTRD